MASVMGLRWIRNDLHGGIAGAPDALSCGRGTDKTGTCRIPWNG
jgi:hypothetical protein